MFGPSDSKEVRSVADSLAKNKVPHDVFSGRDANSRYPHQLRLPDDYICVYEDGGGFLNAQKAVMAFQVCTVTGNLAWFYVTCHTHTEL